MKNKFLIAALILFAALPVLAELTIDDSVSKDYLKNHGHSRDAVWATQKTIAATNGEELSRPVENEKYNLPVIKQVMWFFRYIDPGLDNGSFMNNHDIDMNSGFNDL